MPASDAIALVLFSGGLDSAVALWWAMTRGYRQVKSITFSYGSKEESVGLPCVRSVARMAGVENIVIQLDPLRSIARASSALVDPSRAIPPGVDGPDRLATKAAWVPARNLVMLSMATCYAETQMRNVDLIVGFNREEAQTFPDNSEDFVESFNLVLRDAVLAHRVRVLAPLADLTKSEIVALAAKLGVPIEFCCSCYQPKGFDGKRPIHCGLCQSCILRSRGFRSAGIPDPTLYEVEPA